MNGATKSIIKGDDFTKSFSAIWLGAEPPNPEIKAALLGGCCEMPAEEPAQRAVELELWRLLLSLGHWQHLPLRQAGGEHATQRLRQRRAL